MSDIRTMGVIGAGQMGQGIAQVAAQAGLDVVLVDAFEGVAARGLDRITKGLDALVAKGKVIVTDRDGAVARITTSQSLDALASADFVVEAATENLEIKLGIFRDVCAIAKPSAILASNTSSISITKIAAATKRPESVVGMHFFNPVPMMKLVEVVRAVQTSDATVATTRLLGEKLGKTPVVVGDAPGFVVNRILIPMMIEAIFVFEQGLATKEDIDAGIKLGLNHPMGPLELADLVGLETLLAVADTYHREFGDSKYRAPVLLRNYVAAGWFGRKTGRGFYQYDDKGQKR